VNIFTASGVPPAHITHSRASSATYVLGGILSTAPPDVIRNDDAGPLFEPAATNLVRQSQNLSTAPWSGGIAVSSAAELYRSFAPFWALTKTTAVGSETLAQGLGSVGAGNQLTLTLALLAGTSAVCAVGFYNDVDGWGAAETATEILEGPGVPVDGGFGPGLPNISGLHPTIPTLVRLTRTFLTASTFGLYLYPDGALSTTIGASIKATRVQVEASTRATSYIPTTTATVTRAADVLTPSTTDLSGGTGPAGGYLYVSADNYWVPWINTPYSAAGTRITYRGLLYELAPGRTSLASQTPPQAPLDWLVVGPDNRMAVFDGEINSRTYTNPLPNLRSNRLGLFVSLGVASNAILITDLNAISTMHVQVTDGLYGPVLFQQTYTPEAGQQLLRSQYLVTGVSFPASAILRIGVRGPTFQSQVGIGLIAWGQTETLGCTQFGLRAGIKDYSRKEPDEFGQVQFVRRAFSKTVSASVSVETAQANALQDRLANLRATPAVWIFSTDPALSVAQVVYGFYRDFYTVFEGVNKTVCALEIEGLT
jgi:hypothetical protein